MHSLKGFIKLVSAVAKNWVWCSGGHLWITRFLAWGCCWDESWQSRPEQAACLSSHGRVPWDVPLLLLIYSWVCFFLADKIFDDEDSVDGNRPSSASSSTSSKAPANSRRVGMGTTRRLGSATLGSKSSSKLVAYTNWLSCKVFIVFVFELIVEGLQDWPPGSSNKFSPVKSLCVCCLHATTKLE